jgi:hypothetical protein
MFHLFHLGPLVLGERRQWLLSGVNEDGGFTHPLVGPDLPSGMATLCARFGAQNLRVEPALEAVAAPFGVGAEPLPDRALLPRAVLAFAFLTHHRLFRKPNAVASLLEACAVFEEAAPWARFRSDEPFGILMTQRWRCWRREFVVLGAGSQTRGLELHERPGFVERLRESSLTLGLLNAPKVNSLLITFESGPAWAVEALRAAHGLRELPTVIRMKPGSRRAPEPLELLQLAGALRSAALLSEEEATPEHGAHVELAAERYELTTLATPPPRAPGVESTTHPVCSTPRNAPCPCGSGLKFKRCLLLRSIPTDAASS